MVQNRKFVPHRDRSAEYIVCVTSRSNTSFQGTIEHSQSRETQQFRSFAEMLMLIESRRIVLKLPSPDLTLRSWKETEELKLSGKEENSMGKEDLSDFQKAFQKSGGQEFFIHIMFRQHVSWQGEISWLNSEKSLYFRSMLEMIMLLQEALDEAGVPEADYTFRSWKDKKEEVSQG